MVLLQVKLVNQAGFICFRYISGFGSLGLGFPYHFGFTLKMALPSAVTLR
jgi:hypothetical protein